MSGTPSVNASYAYDALGRRVAKTSNNTVTIFVNSGYQILTEYSSTSNAPFTEIQSFVYATYIDDPIAVINANGKYFYHSNQQFSVGAITDSGGNLVERFGYNAYGKPVTILDSVLVNNEYLFTGRQIDTETGLFYFRARYYDASLGQFISRDPVGYVDGMSFYGSYFIPNKLDPSGLEDRITENNNTNTEKDYGFTLSAVGPDRIVGKNILTLITNDTTDGSLKRWQDIGKDKSGEIITELNDSNEIAKKTKEQRISTKECISTLNIMGHGTGHGGASTKGKPSFSGGRLSQDAIDQIKSSLCDNAVINLCTCGNNTETMKEKNQQLANDLGATVCYCPATNSRGCHCTVARVCLEPKK